jgi:plastocyanin
MKPVLRDRLVLPVLLPLGILVIIVAALYGFSRILLALPPTAATATALAAASGIVVVSAIAASRRQVRLSTIVSMLGATAGIAMLAGGIALAVAPAEEEGEGEGERPVVALAAFNIAFEPTSLTVPADQPFTIRFNNRDAGIQHNVDIFDNPEFSGIALFEGEIITGVREIDYAVDPLAPGGYFFRCIVHPTMVGEMEAVPGGGGGPGGEGGPGGGLTVVAQDIAFDTSTIELVAGAPSKITFDNRDAGVQHNIAIYTDSSLETELFNGELVTGPATVVYEIPPLEAGEYYFQCVVHPNMNGTVVVSEAGGEGGGATGPTGAGPPTGATGDEAPAAGTAEPAVVVAQNIAFDTSTITLPAGQPATITLDNRDAGIQHNIMITTDSTLETQLFNGELITGPAMVEYQIPPLDAGEYYFLCLVHPNMNGTVIVA